MLHPIIVIFNWINSIFSLIILGFGIYFLRLAYLNQESEDFQKYLIWGSILVGFTLLGQIVLKLFFGLIGLFFPKNSQEHYNNPRRYAANETLEQISTDGSKLHLQFFGDKNAKPMILVHGMGLDGNQWDYIRRDLSQKYRLIIVDLAGFGKSNNLSGNFTLERYAKDLQLIIQTHSPNQKPFLAGHSMGGMILLVFCRIYQVELKKMIAGLILINTTYTNPVKTAIFGNLLFALQGILLKPILYLTQALSPLLRLSNLVNYLNGSQYLPTFISGFNGHQSFESLDFAAKYSYLSSPFSLAKSFLEMLKFDSLDVLPKIEVATLVVAASGDIVTLPSASEVLHENIFNNQKVTIEKAAHMSLLEQPKMVINSILSFTEKAESKV